MSLMATVKAYLLGVSFLLPLENSIRQRATLESDANGFQFISYSGEPEQVLLKPEVLPDLLKLALPWPAVDHGKFLSESQEELDALLYPDPAPEQILQFINRWGRVGLLDQRRFKLTQSSVQEFGKTLTNENLGKKKAELLFFQNGKLNREYWNRSLAISHGHQIPYFWVRQEIRYLARCARLVQNLLIGDSRGRDNFTVTRANRMRVLSAWDMAPLFIPEGKDPGKYRNLDTLWEGTWGYQQFDLSSSEVVMDDFAVHMNKYVDPISSMIVRTPAIEEHEARKFGLETALATYLLDLLKNGGIPLRCQECGSTYFPERHRTDGKWCSPTCGSTARTREKRRRDKEKSSSGTRSKTLTRAVNKTKNKTKIESKGKTS